MSFDDRGLIAVVGAALLAWATWLTKRCFSAMSKAEHARVCEGHQKKTAEQFEELKQLIEKSNEDASEKRGAMYERIEQTSRQVAVLLDRSDRDDREKTARHRRLASIPPRDGGK